MAESGTKRLNEEAKRGGEEEQSRSLKQRETDSYYEKRSEVAVSYTWGEKRAKK